MDTGILSDKYYTTTSCLQDLIDKNVYVNLRDGKKIIGILRTFDQYGTVVIQDAVERVYVSGAFGDIERGIFLIRGENVMLLGELSEDGNDEEMQQLKARRLPIEQVLEIQRIEREERELRNKKRNCKLVELGFSLEHEAGSLL